MWRVMVPPTGTLMAGVNWRTGRTVEPESWPPKLKMDVKVTAAVVAVSEAIGPEDTPEDAAVSTLVCTVMPVALPAVAAPIVKPLRVMVKCVDAAMPETSVVMTMELPVMADVAVMVNTDARPAGLAAGFGVAAKNPAG